MSVILICWFGFSRVFMSSRGRSFAALFAFIAKVRSDVKLLFRITRSFGLFRFSSSVEPCAVMCSVSLLVSIVMFILVLGFCSFCLNSGLRSGPALSAFMAMMQSPCFVSSLSLVIINVVGCRAVMFLCPYAKICSFIWVVIYS